MTKMQVRKFKKLIMDKKATEDFEKNNKSFKSKESSKGASERSLTSRRDLNKRYENEENLTDENIPKSTSLSSLSPIISTSEDDSLTTEEALQQGGDIVAVVGEDTSLFTIWS